MRNGLKIARYKRLGMVALYLLATVQFVWCYLWQVRPYVLTSAYEQGTERMPFQGRLLMMPVMRWAHNQQWVTHISTLMHANIYWFPRPMQPEVLVQALIDFACIVTAGLVATSIYRRASRLHLLTPLVYPMVLVLCVTTYILHTIQNFRFIYDLPSLAFFSIALWLIYCHKPVWIFAAVFLVATLNRETTLLLLPIYAISELFHNQRRDNRPDWTRLYSARVLAVVIPLALYWLSWQVAVRHIFAHNPSEFYSRIPQNLGFLISPRAWPQMLGACGYLFPIVLILRRHLRSTELRAWLWVLPIWFAFMFVYGILIETRIFGELIPYMACAAILITEESIAERLIQRTTRLHAEEPHHPAYSQAA
ncbi:hypothetical protein [Granulicella arctica]|uniref:hypothetical protein n=1 Tax=Granulicella arctica TaxID=940613 RepID=UPI0021DF73FE|nr:hypothetical protein [Granulicella arctica]